MSSLTADDLLAGDEAFYSALHEASATRQTTAKKNNMARPHKEQELFNEDGTLARKPVVNEQQAARTTATATAQLDEPDSRPVDDDDRLAREQAFVAAHAMSTGDDPDDWRRLPPEEERRRQDEKRWKAWRQHNSHVHDSARHPSSSADADAHPSSRRSYEEDENGDDHHHWQRRRWTPGENDYPEGDDDDDEEEFRRRRRPRRRQGREGGHNNDGPGEESPFGPRREERPFVYRRPGESEEEYERRREEQEDDPYYTHSGPLGNDNEEEVMDMFELESLLCNTKATTKVASNCTFTTSERTPFGVRQTVISTPADGDGIDNQKKNNNKLDDFELEGLMSTPRLDTAAAAAATQQLPVATTDLGDDDDKPDAFVLESSLLFGGGGAKSSSSSPVRGCDMHVARLLRSAHALDADRGERLMNAAISQHLTATTAATSDRHLAALADKRHPQAAREAITRVSESIKKEEAKRYALMQDGSVAMLRGQQVHELAKAIDVLCTASGDVTRTCEVPKRVLRVACGGGTTTSLTQRKAMLGMLQSVAQGNETSATNALIRHKNTPKLRECAQLLHQEAACSCGDGLTPKLQQAFELSKEMPRSLALATTAAAGGGDDDDDDEDFSTFSLNADASAQLHEALRALATSESFSENCLSTIYDHFERMPAPATTTDDEVDHEQLAATFLRGALVVHSELLALHANVHDARYREFLRLLLNSKRQSSSSSTMTAPRPERETPVITTFKRKLDELLGKTCAERLDTVLLLADRPAATATTSSRSTLIHQRTMEAAILLGMARSFAAAAAASKTATTTTGRRY